jgi:DNA-binding NarL/FixJ family response regulator
MTTTIDRASSSYFPPRGAGAGIEPGWGAVPDESPGPAVHVTVVGSASSLTALEAQLPRHWTVRRVAIDQVGDTDLLVIDGATGGRVLAAVRQHPGTPVVGVVDSYATTDQVVDVLEAGADACVRSGQPALVSSHLRACQRRRAIAA